MFSGVTYVFGTICYLCVRFGQLSGGRDDWIRTSDLCVPNAALYQAEPHPDNAAQFTAYGQENIRQCYKPRVKRTICSKLESNTKAAK